MGATGGRGRRTSGTTRWALATAGALLATVAALLVADPRWFFTGDTQAAYYGWWYHLGTELRSGTWPVLDVHAWRAGEIAAEGQWGLFSPLVVGIGLLASLSPWPLALATAVKALLLVAGSLGVLALARSYGVPPPLAAAAGVAAPMGGMTQYLDLPSWAAGLMIWALFPWVWWALQRLGSGRAGPLPALVLGYLLVTVGYVYGTIMLVVLLAALVAERGVLRDLRGALRVTAAGALCGLVALAVYLPGVLTAAVSRRDDYVAVPGKFTTDVLALLTSGMPTASVHGTTGHLLPYAYLTWALPLLAWVDWGAVRRGWRPLTGLLLLALATLVVLVGPETVGPLRWPLRLAPFTALTWVLLVVVLLVRFRPARLSRLRLGLTLGWALAAAVVAVVRAPEVWRGHVVAAVVVIGGLAALGLGVSRGWSATRLGAGAVALTLSCLAVQHATFPDAPSPDRNLPATRAAYDAPLATAQGDVFVVGGPTDVLLEHPEASAELLAGSAWYLTGHRVANTYTAVSNAAYVRRYCMSYQGSTCSGALATLLADDPTLGVPRVDLLGVSTLVLVRADVPDRVSSRPPDGWHVADRGRWQVTWVRDTVLPGAGRPVWTSPGTRVRTLGVTGRQARFRVEALPATGGRVVLSALGWPGYHTDVGRVAAPVDGYLLAVDLPADAAGRTVTVRFDPPGWRVEQAAWGLAVLLGLVWCVVPPVLRRRRRRGGVPPR